jgi:hypothetical protein
VYVASERTGVVYRNFMYDDKLIGNMIIFIQLQRSVAIPIRNAGKVIPFRFDEKRVLLILQTDSCAE